MTPGAVRDDMTLDDVLDLHDYWRDHPPVQWMVQSYLGIEPRPAAIGKSRAAIPSMPGGEIGGAISPLYGRF